MLKKRLLLLAAGFMACFASATQVRASVLKETFSFDAAAVSEALAPLDPLEEVVGIHKAEADFSFVQANYVQVIGSLNGMFDATSVLGANGANGDHPVLGIPSFLWGCGLGVVGILVVYLISEDEGGKEVQKAETKKALTGCAVGWGAALLIWGVIYLTAARSI